MGGAAVSSADTGAFGSGIEMRSNVLIRNAKRAANAIRGLVESDHNQLFLFTIMVQVDI
jgi:phosphoribosylformylglycinamidine synthase